MATKFNHSIHWAGTTTLVIVLSFLGLVSVAHGQCMSGCYETVQQNGSCKGDSVQIEIKTNGKFLGWQNQEGTLLGLSSPHSQITWVRPALASKYIASVENYSSNRIVNGDFEEGKTGFASDYTYAQTVTKNSQYNIGNSTGSSTAYVNQKDHTSGSGNMLVADGHQDSSKAIYRTSVTIKSGKRYLFSVWVSNIHKELAKTEPDTNKAKPAYFEFYIDKKQVAEYKTPSDTLWHPFSFFWDAPNNKSVDVEIKSKITTTKGNDFAIDDIYMANLVTSQHSISVPACPTGGGEQLVQYNLEPVLSPDGDGVLDNYYIQEPGMAKIMDLGGNVIKELATPSVWDGTKSNGTVADAGYYAIVVNGNKVYRVTLYY